ncbi:general secretion pathway protein GspB [Algibacillus agarilyticus]|uniref:general secretion pathway protein GspB n=1 Tax=Algibacillus agarilyticus TaxID=2234133 RepID=UPI000DCFAA6A|nr:general secretion pathway protein GspB [Algibacillus agarilyticus]
MSFLLDALKKSENDQALRPADLFAEPIKIELEPEAFNESRSKLVIILMVVIIALVAVLFFMLGREFSMNQPTPVYTAQKEQHATSRADVVVSSTLSATPTASNNDGLIAGTQSTLAYNNNSMGDNERLAKTRGAESSINHDTFASAFNKPESIPTKAATPTTKSKRAEHDDAAENNLTQTPPSNMIEGKRLTNTTIDVTESSPISNSLLLRFEKAVAETMALSDQEIYETQRADIVTPLVDMPVAVQNAVPELSFQTHIYSSNIEERWIKVNGKVVRELELIAPNLTLVEIMPQNVVLKLGDDEFSLPALSDW